MRKNLKEFTFLKIENLKTLNFECANFFNCQIIILLNISSIEPFMNIEILFKDIFENVT